MLLLTALLTVGAFEWRADALGELNEASHGSLSLGLRNKPFSVELLTETLQVSWAPESDEGRWWVTARGEAFLAGLYNSPWRDGAKAPGEKLNAFNAGADAGLVRYLPHGLYAGASGGFRFWAWKATATTVIPVPGNEVVISANAIFGWYLDRWLHASLEAGGDLQVGLELGAQAVLSPHARATVIFDPLEWDIAPLVEVRAGVAQKTDTTTKVRLGGLNRYVVPVAGASWAEWWVEDYAAVRAGPTVRTLIGDWTAFADLAYFDGEGAVGFGLMDRFQLARFNATLAGGYAPWIERQPGVGRWAVLLAVGYDWGEF